MMVLAGMIRIRWSCFDAPLNSCVKKVDQHLLTNYLVSPNLICLVETRIRREFNHNVAAF